MTEKARPRVVTFYSYKGGTGRTMALANVAWILASQGKRVLAVDWDLEAPGLHRYFAPFLTDPGWERTEGLIDFLIRYTLAAGRPVEGERASDSRWYSRYADLAPFTEPVNCKFQGSGRVDLVGAGRQDESYPARVHHFDWHLFYGQFGGGAFLDEVITQLAESYDYVLVDSRTGVSDTSGICTVHLPDTLVVLYTLNNQSIEGASGIALDALHQRRAREAAATADGPRPHFVVLPIATRIELAEKEKLTRQRELSRRRFRPLLEHAVRLGRVDNAADYFGRMEVLYDPFYAYGEVLATIADRPNQSNSVLSTMELLTGHITNGEVTRLAGVSDTRQREALKRYEAFASAATPDEADPADVEYDIFISSAAETSDLSRALHDALAPWASVFESSRTLRPGDSFVDTTARAVERSKVIALLAGEELSEGQRREIAAARSNHLRIVPVLFDDAPDPASPEWPGELLSVRIVRSWDARAVAELAQQVLRAAGLETPSSRRPPAALEVPYSAPESWPQPTARGAPTLASPAPSGLPRRGLRSRLAGPVALAVGVVLVVAVASSLLRSNAASADQMLASLRSDDGSPAAGAEYLRELYLVGVRNFSDVRLARADLAESNLRGVDLSRADLTGAQLVGAVLDSAIFNGAMLDSANLAGASLMHAALRDVTLSDTDLRGANLFGAAVPAAALQTARTDATTILPDSTPGPVRRDDDTGIGAVTIESQGTPVPNEPGGGSPVGWVWIGDFDRAAGIWTRPRLAKPNGTPIGEDPAIMKPGGEFRVTGNLVIREALPPDDTEYFRDVPRVGVAQRGSVVAVTEPPVARQREYAVQYWAPVRLICDAAADECSPAR